MTPPQVEVGRELTVQSPLIEGTNLQYAWDSTSLSTFMQCPRRYQLQVLEGWQLKGPSTAIALTFGILFHEGVEHWHRRRAHGESARLASDNVINQIMDSPGFAALPSPEDVDNAREADLADVSDDDEADETGFKNAKIRTRYHLTRALVWYHANYANDGLKPVLLSNGEPAVELSFRFQLPGVAFSFHDQPILYCGHLDQLATLDGANFVVDHKTTKSITRRWREDFDISHQMTGYTLAGQIIGDRPVSGAIVDGIALQVGGVKFGRHPTYRTKSQLNEFVASTVTDVLERAEEYDQLNHWPMNTSGCMFCQYREVCSKPPEVRPNILRTRFEQGPRWNPLANR